MKLEILYRRFKADQWMDGAINEMQFGTNC